MPGLPNDGPKGVDETAEFAAFDVFRCKIEASQRLQQLDVLIDCRLKNHRMVVGPAFKFRIDNTLFPGSYQVVRGDGQCQADQDDGGNRDTSRARWASDLCVERFLALPWRHDSILSGSLYLRCLPD